MRHICHYAQLINVHCGNMNLRSDPEFFNKLGGNLRKFRLNKGLTQEMLADQGKYKDPK